MNPEWLYLLCVLMSVPLGAMLYFAVACDEAGDEIRPNPAPIKDDEPQPLAAESLEAFYSE